MNLRRLDHLIISLHLLSALLCSVYGQSCKALSDNKENDTCICDGWTSVPKNIAQSTELLDLSSNNIKIIGWTDFQDFENLKDLKLQNNNLTYIEEKSFETNKKLISVYLSENKLEILLDTLFINNSELKCITLRRNFRLGSYISKLKSSFLISNSLQSIDLSSCDITNVGANLFSGTPSLTLVDLSANKIVYLDSKIISPLQMLKKFYLNWNPVIEKDLCNFKDLTKKYSDVVFELNANEMEKKKTCKTENFTKDNKQTEKATTIKFSNIPSANVTKPAVVVDNTVFQEIESVITEGASTTREENISKNKSKPNDLSPDNTVGGVDPLLIIIISNAHLFALIIVVSIIAWVLFKRRASKTGKPKLVYCRNNDSSHYEEVFRHDYMIVNVPPEIPPRPNERFELSVNDYDAQGYMNPRIFQTHKYDHINRIENNLN